MPRHAFLWADRLYDGETNAAHNKNPGFEAVGDWDHNFFAKDHRENTGKLSQKRDLDLNQR